ncbi:hypothetical protein AAZX31_12G161700 [Glycine max]
MTRWHSKAFPSSLLNPSPSPSLSLRFLTSFSPFHFSPSPSLFISSLPLFWFSLLLRIKTRNFGRRWRAFVATHHNLRGVTTGSKVY